MNDEFEFFVADTRQFEQIQPMSLSGCGRVNGITRMGHPLANRSSVSAAELLSYLALVTIRPPNLRKVLVQLSGHPDYAPNVECESPFSLMSVVLRSDAIGICGAYSDVFCTPKAI